MSLNSPPYPLERPVSDLPPNSLMSPSDMSPSTIEWEYDLPGVALPLGTIKWRQKFPSQFSAQDLLSTFSSTLSRPRGDPDQLILSLLSSIKAPTKVLSNCSSLSDVKKIRYKIGQTK